MNIYKNINYKKQMFEDNFLMNFNVLKIATNIDEILSEEMKIKDQYNKLLQGASMEMVGVNIDDEIFSEKELILLKTLHPDALVLAHLNVMKMVLLHMAVAFRILICT